MEKEISRRAFLKGTASLAAAGAVAGLTGCASETECPEVEEVTCPETTTTSTGAMNAEKSFEKWEFEIAPDPIADDKIGETITNDIIVVGAGMAGLTTALRAAQCGAKVTLFSASSHPISRGGSNFAAYSKVIADHNLPRLDVSKYFYAEMRAASFQVDQKKWMRGYNNSEEAMDWLIDLVEEDGLKVILESDNEKIDDNDGPSWAHAFNTEGNEAMVSTGQQGAVESLERHLKALGVEIYYNMAARQLIRPNNTGRVTGVIAEKVTPNDGTTPQEATGEYVKFVANKAVVLATGDFSANKQMLAKYCPQVLDVVSGGMTEAGSNYDTSFNLSGIYRGEGQQMGLWIGAAWQKAYPNAPMMQGAWGGSTEPCGFHMGLNVNMNTERYQREDVSSPYTANHLLTQPGHVCYGIWTANYATEVVKNGHEWRMFGTNFDKGSYSPEEVLEMWNTDTGMGAPFNKSATLDELAGKLGLDAEKLKAVVKRYNELCDKGVDEDFGKRSDYMIKIDENGPFYASQNYALFMTVMGGLRTSANMEVCDENDQPIPGLFNVGQMIGDMYANTYNFAVPGHNYGIACLTFGYLLGQDLANGVFD